MVTQAFAHAPVVRAPYYAANSHTAIHRYFDDDFVDRFLDDLREHRLGTAELTAWRMQDLFGGYTDCVTLRQPIHRTYYLISCEVACDRLGYPAFDPNRIRSAGYVIRRAAPGQPSQSWRVENGRATGEWVPTVEGVDPDEARRVRAVWRTKESARETAYTGEQVHPLHVRAVTDPGGRSRTILFGFLAISGSTATRRRPGRRGSGLNLDAIADAALKELPRPFGTSDIDALASDALLVREGKPSRAFLALLRVLVERYRVAVESDPDNLALEKELESWRFELPEAGRRLLEGRPRASEVTVKAWLEEAAKIIIRDPVANPDDRYSPLLAYLSEELAGAPYVNRALPSASGTFGLDLRCSPERAQRLGRLLKERAVALVDEIAQDVPVPRFGHGNDDVYVAVPFVRYGSDECEHIAWGPASEPFRIASPYSSEAARPTLVPLPSLKDLRGRPKSGFLAPDDLARKLLGMRRVGNGLEFADGNGLTFNLCWMFAFSLPSITICAFILLFVMLFLLNIIFFWMPWVFLRIPFLCKLALPKPAAGGASA